MLIHVLSNPDWINIPCVQKIPAFVVCQKIMKEREDNKKFTGNYSSPNKEVEMCGNAQLFITNRCVSFIKYNFYTNLSDSKYDINTNGFKEVIDMDKTILFQYFTIIQHFYKQPLQFTIALPFKNAYIHYEPLQTPYFLKLTWNKKINNNSITQYHGYNLHANKLVIEKIPSTVFKCEDGSYIDKLLICDEKNDCTEGLDEKLCSCYTGMNLLAVGCKYVCIERSNPCSCSDFYFTCLSSSTCIPYLKVCDGHRDCLHNEDEYCEAYTDIKPKTVINGLHLNIFTCLKHNTTISLLLLNDFIPDCNDSGKDESEYFNLITNPSHIHISCSDSQKLPCIPGHSHCFHLNKLCVFEFHQNMKILKYCRNGAHLYNCTEFQCAGYFKCPMSYCVPFDLICNGE